MSNELPTVVGKLLMLEKRLLNRGSSNYKKDLDKYLSKSFYEYGIDQKKYYKKDILELFESGKLNESVKFEEGTLKHTKYSDNVYLLNYNIIRKKYKTKHYSLWQKENGNWKTIFHQGEIIKK